MPAGSALLHWGFVVLSVALAVGFVAAAGWSTGRLGADPATARRARIGAGVGALLWLAITWLAARNGVLRFSPFPPTMIGLVVAVIALVIGITRSELGRRLAFGLPLSVLVGFQAFRIVVELLLHRAYREGLMPVQMSYAGYNFDIVTGVLAALLGIALAGRGADRVPRGLVVGWNGLGLLLLLNVLVIALLSAPTPFRKFMAEPSNEWIAHAPWVWLPAVMVLAALLGHALVFRRVMSPSPSPS